GAGGGGGSARDRPRRGDRRGGGPGGPPRGGGGGGGGGGRGGRGRARAARAPEEPVLVPDTPELATSVIDVRDLAGWLLDNATEGRTGTFDTRGPLVPFGEWIELTREVGGHTGPVVRAPREWLVEQKV